MSVISVCNLLCSRSNKQKEKTDIYVEMDNNATVHKDIVVNFSSYGFCMVEASTSYVGLA